MSKLDEAKERLMTLRFWLGIIVGLMISLGGWLLNNYETAKAFILILSGLGMIALCFALVLVNRKIEKKYKDIRELKK